MLEESTMPMLESPFVNILNGTEPGTIIARDDEKRFAIIQNLHPEAAVHWIALPFEPIASTEELAHTDRERFLDLLEFAMQETRARVEEVEGLGNGFTIKFHIAAFETIPHAKLHILSCE